MRLPVDDEIYNVNSVWLGPPNKTLPWRARYVAYGVGLVVFVLLQMVERRLGIGLGFFSLAYSLLATVGLTRLVLVVVDHDRPLGSVVMAFVARGRGAAGVDASDRHTFRPARVACRPRPPRAGPTPPRRAHRSAPRETETA